MPCTRGHKLSLAYYVPDFFSVLTTDANHHERRIQLSEEVVWSLSNSRESSEHFDVSQLFS